MLDVFGKSGQRVRFAPVEITHVLIASLWCLGFWKAFDAEMIFSRLDTDYLQKLPDWIYKPLVGCTICMASIHGGTWFIVLNGLSWWIVPFVVCVAGLNFIFSAIIGRHLTNHD